MAFLKHIWCCFIQHGSPLLSLFVSVSRPYDSVTIMQQSPFWETDNRSAVQRNPCLLWRNRGLLPCSQDTNYLCLQPDYFEYEYVRGSGPHSPDTPRPYKLAPKLILWISLGSKKKEPRCACLSEAKASHSGHPPVQTIGTAGCCGYHPSSYSIWSGEMCSKEEIQGFPFGSRTIARLL
jgi:hypothetical protein